MRLLVTGANGDIAEAIGRILKQNYPTATVDGADCQRHPARPACLFDRVHPLPLASRDRISSPPSAPLPGYDRVIPVPEPELMALAAQADSWRSALPLVMNAPWVITTFCDKQETARWLARCGDCSARTIDLREAKAGDLPIVAKPRAGWGSKGVEIIRTPALLAALRAEATGEWIAQEFLDAANKEYTCAIVTRRRCGEYGQHAADASGRADQAGDDRRGRFAGSLASVHRGPASGTRLHQRSAPHRAWHAESSRSIRVFRALS